MRTGAQPMTNCRVDKSWRSHTGPLEHLLGGGLKQCVATMMVARRTRRRGSCRRRRDRMSGLIPVGLPVSTRSARLEEPGSQVELRSGASRRKGTSAARRCARPSSPASPSVAAFAYGFNGEDAREQLGLWLLLSLWHVRLTSADVGHRATTLRLPDRKKRLRIGAAACGPVCACQILKDLQCIRVCSSENPSLVGQQLIEYSDRLTDTACILVR